MFRYTTYDVNGNVPIYLWMAAALQDINCKIKSYEKKIAGTFILKSALNSGRFRTVTYFLRLCIFYVNEALVVDFENQEICGVTTRAQGLNSERARTLIISVYKTGRLLNPLNVEKVLGKRTKKFY